ncbi:hypothetical protein WH47_11117 [Habropoda laboriosa]|uniref:Uncharacterized protein n=1 Tax=Habropoda laboriosa TaxID=597456 RepID=A0A0L7RAD5_9HYME|nr:hypothetical protein WH47_11117 [Habropoda laboriosa]
MYVYIECFKCEFKICEIYKSRINHKLILQRGTPNKIQYTYICTVTSAMFSSTTNNTQHSYGHKIGSGELCAPIYQYNTLSKSHI